MKTRIALLSGLLTLVAGAALAIPTTTIPSDQDISLATDLDQWSALSELESLETNSAIPLQISQQVPWPCDDPFDPILFILGPMGPTTGPFDPTQCIPWPWPF